VVYLVEPAASPVAVPSPDENSGIPDTHTSGASCEPKAPSNFAIESTSKGPPDFLQPYIYKYCKSLLIDSFGGSVVLNK